MYTPTSLVKHICYKSGNVYVRKSLYHSHIDTNGNIPASLNLSNIGRANDRLIPSRQILDSSKLKDFADYNFKLDENDRKFSKGIENTQGKEEIARNEQFILFPQCFQKTCTADM